MPLTIHSSNHLEALAGHLSLALAQAGSDCFEPSLIVVPNPATGRWLTHRYASMHGVAANFEMPLPASFFWRVLQAWLPDEVASPFESKSLVWRILARLPDFLGEGDFEPLRHYLTGDVAGRDQRLFQLAQKIAEVFDQYLVYRPEMVLGWEQGDGKGWQPRLWRALMADAGSSHRAELFERLLDAMDGPPKESADLPGRITFFGINSLPPAYLEIIRKLAAYRDLTIFHLNPCSAYWSDIRSEKALAREESPEAAYLELGNPLLASWGYVGQVFLDQLLSLGELDDALMTLPAGDGLLQRVQRDIFELVDGRETPAKAPDEAWPSLQFHGVHTPFREVQVLHDNLLACLEHIDGLRPRDILVMAPDMAAYAPFVEAVFGTAEDVRYIPYSIGDRSPGGENPLAEALAWLLDLPGSRFTASEILSLLAVPAVQARFGLDDEALARIRDWVAESGIRWAIDGEHREALDLPPDDGLHSWRFGLRRLFLGYATPADDDERIYADGTVPYRDIDGAELLWAGALESLIDRLDEWRRKLDEPAAPRVWQSRFAELFDALFSATDDEERALLQTALLKLDEIADQADAAGFADDLPLAVIAELLDEALADTTPARGFLDGGVTFSNLLPMRALPFRVICLLGMNDSDFPRQQKAPSFDLIARYPRRGDRNRRRDDRYLFLEALISARDALIVSWQSRDPRSDKPRLPAEVVSELIDYVDAAHPGEKLAERLFVQHPLQAFDRRYFDGSDPRLFSYDADQLIGADASATRFDAGLPLPAETRTEALDLDELIRFFRNPAAAFLHWTLQLRQPDEVAAIDDREPFRLGGLEQWQVRDRLVRDMLQARNLDDIDRRLLGEGLLPHGSGGEVQRRQMRGRAERLGKALSGWLQGNPWEAEAVNFSLAGVDIIGQLERATKKGMVEYRVGSLRAGDRLMLWIRHLALAIERGNSGEGVFVAEDQVLQLTPVEKAQAKDYMQNLLDHFMAGLRLPLPFFPETSWRFASGDEKWAEAWYSDDYGHRQGEGDDAARRIIYRDAEPLDDEFKKLAEEIWQPVIEHVRVEK